MMNEYISRVCFNLIAQVRVGRPFTPQMKSEIDWLFDVRSKLDPSDKLIALIDSLSALLKEGGLD